MAMLSSSVQPLGHVPLSMNIIIPDGTTPEAGAAPRFVRASEALFAPVPPLATASVGPVA